jgi:hypothetical protein
MWRRDVHGCSYPCSCVLARARYTRIETAGLVIAASSGGDRGATDRTHPVQGALPGGDARARGQFLTADQDYSGLHDGFSRQRAFTEDEQALLLDLGRRIAAGL